MALTAVVTGASGYLAGEVIHQLLAKGYNVRGTVTNVEDRRKTGPLLALRRALPGKLTLTEADLFEPGSFDDVVKGADFVFHTASNVIFDSANPEVRADQPESYSGCDGFRHNLKARLALERNSTLCFAETRCNILSVCGLICHISISDMMGGRRDANREFCSTQSCEPVL